MKTIEQYIDTEMPGKIARKRNSPFLALLVLAVGIGMWALLCTVKMEDSLSATCLTLGLICTVLGLILTAMNLSVALTHFVYLPTHSRMREKKVYIISDDYKDVVEAVNNGNLQSLATMRPVVSSISAIRILAVTVNVYSFKPSGTRVAILSRRPRCTFSLACRQQVLFT